jgi:hypothetical protein
MPTASPIFGEEARQSTCSPSPAYIVPDYIAPPPSKDIEYADGYNAIEARARRVASHT